MKTYLNKQALAERNKIEATFDKASELREWLDDKKEVILTHRRTIEAMKEELPRLEWRITRDSTHPNKKDPGLNKVIEAQVLRLKDEKAKMARKLDETIQTEKSMTKAFRGKLKEYRELTAILSDFTTDDGEPITPPSERINYEISRGGLSYGMPARVLARDDDI